MSNAELLLKEARDALDALYLYSAHQTQLKEAESIIRRIDSHLSKSKAATQGGQDSAAAPSHEGHAAGPACAAPVGLVERLIEWRKAAIQGPYFVGVDDAEDCPDHERSGLSLIDTGRSSDWPVARLCEWPTATFIVEWCNAFPQIISALETGVQPAQGREETIEECARVCDVLSDNNDVLESMANGMEAGSGVYHKGARIELTKAAKAIRALKSADLPAGDTARAEDDPIVGHKTMRDGSHTPLRKKEADALMARIDLATEQRRAALPDERSAINAMFNAYDRLRELGWREAMYCPKDGSSFNVLEPGSTGIHTAHYQGEWPDGCWWVEADGDLWPSHPILFKLTAAPDNAQEG